MENRYQSEIEEFHKNFDRFTGKRIVLYGIGRYTATLTEGVKNHCFIGLMDKDKNNIGREMFGLPVISLEEAEEKADLIIINTSGTYWNTIYHRIRDSKIPVYFLNGKPAAEETEETIDSDYWNHSCEELAEKIRESEVVSFDFYDTLFSRKVCNPRDVFEILERKAECGGKFSFTELRNNAIKELHENYTLDELYGKMVHDLEQLGESCFWLRALEKEEITLEKKLLLPRVAMLQCLEDLVKNGKEVYIISDMYLPKSFYLDIFAEYGMAIDSGRILISCEERKSKWQGSLWEEYAVRIVKGRKALHIGDSEKSDIEWPEKYGISGYKTASVMELLRLSSLKEMETQVTNLGESILFGTIFAEILQNSFRLNEGHGKIKINSPEEMGYMVFGPVILGFLDWLYCTMGKDSIEKLVFLSRDGYFLKEDFEYYCEISDIPFEDIYIGISRQLAMTASIRTEEDMQEFINMPYSGTPAELLEDRFSIKTDPEDYNLNLSQLYEKYGRQMWDYAEKIRRNYLNYLETQALNDRCAIVDLGFYGNNQRYLNELTGLHMKGYYFNADLSEKNPNAKKNSMQACYQKPEDRKGRGSSLLQKMIYLESFLTAPYGMIKSVDEQGNFICAKGRSNQKNFLIKEKINNGVKKFIREYILLCQDIKPEMNIKGTIGLIDTWYGLCMSGKVDFSEEIKKSFYNDNAMMNRFEASLFE